VIHMLGDLLLSIIEKRPKPLQALLAQIREENHQLAMARAESGQQAPAYIIRRPTSPASPTQKIREGKPSYVV